MSTQDEWSAWFAWLPRISPINDQRKPLADHECKKCGQLDCECERKS